MQVKGQSDCEPSHYLLVIVPMILVMGITSIVILMHNFIYFSLYLKTTKTAIYVYPTTYSAQD